MVMIDTGVNQPSVHRGRPRLRSKPIVSDPSPIRHDLATPAGPICWFEWGTPSARPSLLLLHATGFHARLWDATIAWLSTLAGSDLHIVAPDLRGHGRSYKPASILDWNATADDLTALVDTAFPGTILGIGHSMGGFCVTRLAARMPDRFARLLLVDPVILPPDIYQPDAPIPDPADHPVARRRNRWTNVEAMIDAFASRLPYSRWQAQALDDYCRYGLLPADDGDGFVLACPPQIEASAYQGSFHNDAMPSVAAVDCPVTVLRARTGERTGAMDFSISPTWRGVASRFADGRDLHWPDVSHFVPMEQPERLGQCIVDEWRAAQN